MPIARRFCRLDKRRPALRTALLAMGLCAGASSVLAASGAAMAPMAGMQGMQGMQSMQASAPQAAPQQDWAAQLDQTKIGRRTPMTLIVHAAKDCTYCAQWEGDNGGMHDYQAWAAAHPHDKLVIVNRSAIANNELSMDYPPAQRWMFTKNRAAGWVKPLTPTFDVFVGTKLVWRTSGLDSWNKGVFPAIKTLDARRGLRVKRASTAATMAAPGTSPHA